MSEILIRRARAEDVPALLDIYNHFVVHTAVTFDVAPRTLQQRLIWFDTFRESGRHQCLVAAKDGVAIGWASSGPFKDRAAYDTSVETSIYLKPGLEGQGLGRRLYQALFDALAGEDVHRAYGGISLPNDASVALHEAMGFRHFGTYSEVGRKFGRYWDVAWFERKLD